MKNRLANSMDYVAIVSGLTPKEQKRASQWFARRSGEEQASIIVTSTQKILPQLKRQEPMRTEDGFMYLAALQLSIRQSGFDVTRKRGYRVAGTKEFNQFDELRDGILHSVKSKRKAPLRKELFAYWGDVRTLKLKGTGFLLISRYLLKAHKIKVSPSYLNKLWNEVEGAV